MPGGQVLASLPSRAREVDVSVTLSSLFGWSLSSAHVCHYRKLWRGRAGRGLDGQRRGEGGRGGKKDRREGAGMGKKRVRKKGGREIKEENEGGRQAPWHKALVLALGKQRQLEEEEGSEEEKRKEE